MSDFSLEDLEVRIASRSQASSQESWTAKLIAGGTERAAKKFGEEAIELVLAAMGQDKKPVVSEAGDVLYHLLVLLKTRGISLKTVMAELENRTQQSGLAEKAARAKPGS